MKLVAASVITLSVVSAIPTYAEESSPQRLSSADDTAEVEFRWDSAAAAKSLLLPQIRAVYKALNASLANDRTVNVETTQVVLADNNTPSTKVDNCRHMALPGSRFMTTRCFYTSSSSEADFNDFQVRTDIEQMRRQRDLYFLEVAEYSLAYRRSLKE